MRNYHVVLADGSERDVKASAFIVDHGSAVFANANGETALAYAPGEWKSVELETRDDRE